MKLAVSNIAFDVEASQAVYERMRQNGIQGLEIAPTKFFAPDPYTEDNILGARALADVLRQAFWLQIVSMQSIWYGRSENLWEGPQAAQTLLQYTERAAAFAAAAGCRNLVFGCPRNRLRPQDAPEETALDFFRRAGDAVQRHGVQLALEPNPPIYHTNFLNTTAECAAFLRRAAHPALRMNLDVGTLLENGEDIDTVCEAMDLIGHVHISRPGLGPVQPLALHRRLARALREGGYEGWVSLEMADAGLAALYEAMRCLAPFA